MGRHFRFCNDLGGRGLLLTEGPGGFVHAEGRSGGHLTPPTFRGSAKTIRGKEALRISFLRSARELIGMGPVLLSTLAVVRNSCSRDFRESKLCLQF